METKPEKQTLTKIRKTRSGKGLSLKRRLFRKCQRVCGNKSKRGKRTFKSMLSSPKMSSLIILSMGAFCFMCYLLGLDPTLIPITLVFMILVTLSLLEGNQRSVVVQSMIPDFIINFCLYVMNIFSSKKTNAKSNSNITNIASNNNIEDIHYNENNLDNLNEPITS